MILLFILIFGLIFSLSVMNAENSKKYSLNLYEKEKLEIIVSKINSNIQKKGIDYKNDLNKKIDIIINKKALNLRIRTFFEEIKIELKKLEKLEEFKKLEIKNTTKNKISENNPSNIDYNLIKNNWLELYNQVRKDLGKKEYTLNSKLSETALEWSKLATERGTITHKRNSGDSYYDYNKITSWFKERGVVCENLNRVTHSENIGYGIYNCSDGNCTDELNTAIKSTFTFYMSEKGKTYKPHYNSIINDYFTQIGVGIDTSKSINGYFEYYITIHYCTNILD